MADLGNTQYFKVKSGPELNVKDVLSTVYTASDCRIYYVR